MRSIFALSICLLVAAALAQPFTPSELAWPTGRNGSSVSDCSGVTAVNSLAAIAINTPGVVTLHGSGGTFSILSSPTHGALTGLDTVAGTATYTPDTDYYGADVFTFQVQSGACITNATVYISVVNTNAGSPSCVSVTGVLPVDIDFTLCWTLQTNGVTVSSGCSSGSQNLPGYFDGTLCVYVLICDVTNTVGSLGYSSPFGALSIKSTNWFKLNEQFGPQGNCRTLIDSYFFCNDTANTNLHLEGRYASNLGTGGSNYCFIYYGNVLVTNLSRGSGTTPYDYTWSANVAILASNKATITISNFTCNANPQVWATNTLTP